MTEIKIELPDKMVEVIEKDILPKINAGNRNNLSVSNQNIEEVKKEDLIRTLVENYVRQNMRFDWE